jgi:hypothetical protein
LYGLLFLEQRVVIQDPAHLVYQIHPHFGAQVGLGELLCQVQELLPLVIIQGFTAVGLVCHCRRRSDLQPLAAVRAA